MFKRKGYICSKVLFCLIIAVIAFNSPAQADISVEILKPTSNKKIVLSKNITVKGKVEIPDHPEKEEKARIFWFITIKNGEEKTYWIGTTKSEEEKTLSLSGIPFPEKNSSFGDVPVKAYCPDQIYEGTGDYVGEGALQVTILEGGGNYEGFILENPNSSDQDMVIGENTGNLEGCVYYIKGYCTDASLGIPDVGGVFGPPWTSESTSNWAYWERKAVIYANENNYSAYEILDAIWYISDRSGWYNEILDSISYPSNGPTKNWEADATPPTPPVVIDDGDITWDNTQLHAIWTSEELESGIVEYSYAIGSDTGATDVVDWTSAGGVPEVTHTGLQLTAGTYYFTVNAKNGEGLWSEHGYSDGILVVGEEFNEQTVYNFPNPFSPEKDGVTTIRFSLSEIGDVSIKIYDAFGDLVWDRSIQGAVGEKLIDWNGKNKKDKTVANGVYFLKVESQGKSVVKKIAVLR